MKKLLKLNLISNFFKSYNKMALRARVGGCPAVKGTALRLGSGRVSLPLVSPAF